MAAAVLPAFSEKRRITNAISKLISAAVAEHQEDSSKAEDKKKRTGNEGKDIAPGKGQQRKNVLVW